VKKTAEEQIKSLFTKHSFPPLEVIIPILEKTGKGEQELTAQTYDTSLSLANELKEILGLKDNSMKTLAKMMKLCLVFMDNATSLLNCQTQSFPLAFLNVLCCMWEKT